VLKQHRPHAFLCSHLVAQTVQDVNSQDGKVLWIGLNNASVLDLHLPSSPWVSAERVVLVFLLLLFLFFLFLLFVLSSLIFLDSFV
jgi:hypothetical protein